MGQSPGLVHVIGWALWGRRLWLALAVAVAGLWWQVGYVWTIEVLVAAGGLVVLAHRETTLVDRLLIHEEAHVIRCRIRSTWHRMARGNGLARADYFPTIRRRRIAISRSGGLSFKVRPAPGQHLGTWNGAIPGLRNSWRVAEISIEDRLSSRGRATGLLDVTCSTHGIITKPIPWPFPALAPAWPLTAVPLGVIAGGEAVSLDLITPPHALVAGPSGGGKSTLFNTILAGVAARPDVSMILLDLKGVDLNAWAPRATTIVHDAADAGAALRHVLRLILDRREILRRAGLKEWTPTPDGPMVLVLIDEFREVLAEDHETVLRIANLGRALGVRLLIGTQFPSHHLADEWTQIRANLGARLALGWLSKREAGMVLGDDNLPGLWPRYPAGVGRLVIPGHQSRTVRVYWSDDDIAEIVRATTGFRRSLPA